MSSARSPDLRLELATDWRVVSGLLLWIAIVTAAAWQAQLTLVSLAIVTLILLGLGLPVIASQFFPGSGARLVWSADGRWHYVPARGASEELELSVRSRAFPGGALLIFARTRTLPWVLLLQHRSGNETLRRLRARLSLDRGRRDGARGVQGAGAAGDFAGGNAGGNRRAARPGARN